MNTQPHQTLRRQPQRRCSVAQRIDQFRQCRAGGRALRELMLDSTLAPAWALCQPNRVLIGKPIPVRPLEVLAPEALEQLA